MQVLLLTDSEIQNAKPEKILNRMLSTKTAISTDSSLAEINQRAQEDASLKTFSSIGVGQCGTIYALKGTTMVVKIPNSPEKEDVLFADFKNHHAVYEAFKGVSMALRVHVHVPALKMWVDPTSEHFWSLESGRFDKNVKVPNYGLVSERIYSLPQPVRSALVDAFAPKAVKDQKASFLSRAENKDCLIRLYLGRRNDDHPPVSANNFHLRNFPLHVNEMERLQLDLTYYAKLIAQALAIIHWRAKLDANDVEFVFGSSPIVNDLPIAQDLQGANKNTAARMFSSDFQHRTVSMWMLDFNQCKTFKQDAEGMKQLVDGFYWNDPYYPTPGSTKIADRELWNVFANHYLEVSREFVCQALPQGFIKAVEDRYKKRSMDTLFG